MEWTTKMEGGGSLYLRDEGNYLYLEATRPEGGEGLYKVILQGLQGRQVLGTMSPSEHGLKLSRMVSRSTMGHWGCLPLTKVICQMSFPFGEETGVQVPMGTAVTTQTKVVEVPDVLFGEQGISPVSLVVGDVVEEAKKSETKPEQAIEQYEQIQERVLQGQTPEEEQWEMVEIPTVEEEPDRGFRLCKEPQAYLTDPLLLPSLRDCRGVLLSEEEGGFSLALPYTPQEKFPLTPLFCFGQYTQLQGRAYLLFSFRQGAVPYVPDMA